MWKYNTNEVLPDHVTVIDFFSDELLDECGEAQVDIHTIRLWGQAEFWTPLEAALLLAGIPPDDEDLYAVSLKSITDNDFSETEVYIYKFSRRFINARDYLFLFERSSQAYKSTPIEWVTYFKNTIMPPHLFFEPSYCFQWLNFFSIKLNEGDTSEANNLTSEKN